MLARVPNIIYSLSRQFSFVKGMYLGIQLIMLDSIGKVKVTGAGGEYKYLQQML